MPKGFTFSVFNTIFSRRDSKIFLAFSFLPLLVPLLAGNMANINSDYTGSFLSYLEITLLSQFRLVLPVLIFSILTSSVFRDEIDSGILFLYKDLKREAIFKAKIIGLIALFAIYLMMTMVIALLSFYLFIVPKLGLTPPIFPVESLVLQQSLLLILSVISLYLILIVLVSRVSITSKTIVAVLAGVFFTLFSATAPLLVGVKYIIPTTYAQNLTEGNLIPSLFIILGISSLYYLFFYFIGKKAFSKVEF